MPLGPKSRPKAVEHELILLYEQICLLSKETTGVGKVWLHGCLCMKILYHWRQKHLKTSKTQRLYTLKMNGAGLWQVKDVKCDIKWWEIMLNDVNHVNFKWRQMYYGLLLVNSPKFLLLPRHWHLQSFALLPQHQLVVHHPFPSENWQNWAVCPIVPTHTHIRQ